MWKYAALISYSGTLYCGWQKQKGSAAEGAPSIQETLEKALLEVTREEKVMLMGSGRTDSGVHAVGQTVHFVTSRKEWDVQNLKNGLNSFLPSSIRILAVQGVPLEFHSQRSASHKQYSFYFQQGPCPLPHLEPYSWWIKKRLDDAAMNRALQYLVGEHDYKPFQAAGAPPGRSTVRKILEADVTRVPISLPQVFAPANDQPLEYVRVRVVGTGFLKQMVRGIAGTLLQIGEGRRPPEAMREILETGNRKLVGATAPGRGLWLERVWYPGLDW